ncbi:unnamed protein product [Adineta ricciae]|uniref:Uncharacterized protein n=2 Tax=Adineta ricciae TaxID=249248 RepID=A0A814X6E6_ADIRI|nr:unnamed protein product [Adineta ricciae]
MNGLHSILYHLLQINVEDFFDPNSGENKLSANIIMSETSPLIVIVSGGGPVGLTFSLNLVMMMGEKVRITIYEGRWFMDENGKVRWRDKEQGNRRRDQVVSLQDHVIDQLPKYVRRGLFKNIDERVWPKSRNIPIREVEDRLFELVQPFVETGQIQLVPERLSKEFDCIRKGSFDILVGADGLESFVRKYSNIPMISEGTENACGVAFNIPESEEVLHQALNCILTTSQTRFLVNSSFSRSGYLNIRLIESEFKELNEYIEKCKTENKPWKLPEYDDMPTTPLWTIIRQGLEYFKISPKFVTNIAPIRINVCYTSVVVREIHLSDESENKTSKTALVCLMGDAAMDVHFWSGRGMNTGMKGAIGLARNIYQSCISKNSLGENVLRLRCPFLKFLDYEGFMARLRARELQGRSLDVLIIPIDDCVIKSYFHIHLTESHAGYKKKLVEKLKKTRDALEQLPDWPHRNRPVTDDELEAVAKRLSPLAIAQLCLANPAVPRELSDVEILIEDTFPFDTRGYSPLPKLTTKTQTQTSFSDSEPLKNINGEPGSLNSSRRSSTTKRVHSHRKPSKIIAEIPVSNMQILPEINHANVPFQNAYQYYQQNVSHPPTPSHRFATPWADFYIYQ